MSEENNKLNQSEKTASNIPDIDIRTLRNNRGAVVFSREFLTEHPTEEFLKAIFSNFFPVAAENHHKNYMYDKIKMFGYSKHFREISEGEVIPEYEIIIIQDDDGIRFDKMVEKSF